MSGEFYTHLAPNDLCGEDTCKNGQVCVIILLLSLYFIKIEVTVKACIKRLPMNLSISMTTGVHYLEPSMITIYNISY